MKSLAAIQHRFAASLEGRVDALACDAFAEDINDDGRMSPRERISIYQSSSRFAAINALEQVYPVCLKILGERCFQGLARQHSDIHPSTDPDLNVYGREFPNTLGAFLQALDSRQRQDFAGMDYLPELARFEWLWNALYYGENDPLFDAVAFARDAAVDPASIRLVASHSLRLFASQWPVYALWQAQRSGFEPELEAGAGDRLVLSRRGFEAQAEAVEPAMFELLSALLRGERLEQLSEMAGGDQLAACISRGWICGHRCTGSASG